VKHCNVRWQTEPIKPAISVLRTEEEKEAKRKLTGFLVMLCNSWGTALLRNQYAPLYKTHADCACNSMYRFKLKSFLPVLFATASTRRLTHGMRVISQFLLYFNYTTYYFLPGSLPNPVLSVIL